MQFRRQFENPTGLLGRLAGFLMAHMNKNINVWTLSFLDPEPHYKVLEIGYGPGIGIRLANKRFPQGLVAGLDISELMKEAASRRNHEAIAAGRVELKVGGVENIPFQPHTFDGAYTVNSIQIWPDPVAGLINIKTVVKQGAKVVATVQPRWAKSDNEVKCVGDKIVNQFQSAGYQDVEMHFKKASPMSIVCVTGISQ